ncbi:MAG: DUF4012 domain-containing protein [Candidatus Kerfeldbacteria bacterium]|nr:DUF4012 domain-containing protein [Candidatus Kerfeldbacteria bacterium]
MQPNASQTSEAYQNAARIRRRSKAYTQVRLSVSNATPAIPSGNIVDLKAAKSSALAAQQALEQPKRRKWHWFSRSKSTVSDPQKNLQQSAVLSQPVEDSTPSSASDFFITYEDPSSSPLPKQSTLAEPTAEHIPVGSLAPAVASSQVSDGTDDSIPPERRVVLSPVLLKPLATFAAVGALLISPILLYAVFSNATDAKQEVLGVSQDAIQHFTNAGISLTSLDSGNAHEEFSTALEKLKVADQIIEQFGLLGKLAPSSEVSSGKHLLKASEHVAVVGTYVSQIVDAISQESSNFATLLSTVQEQLAPLEKELQEATVELERVDPGDVPIEYRETVSQLQTIFPELKTEVASFRETLNALLPLLGMNGEQHYLVLFQNSAERRATGGFIGSFATLTIANGEVSTLDVPEGGTYDVSGTQRTILVPPAPLGLVTDAWELQDVNWSPDFPWTARKAQTMYQDGGGVSTDGVIAMDTEVLRQLLSVIGEVQIPHTDITVTSETVSDVLMRQIAEVRETSTPKAIIASLVPEILHRSFSLSAEQTLTMLTALDRLMVEKHLLVYSRDEELQQQFVTLGWAGELRSTSGDYVHVNFSNIAGGKTDEQIDSLIDLDTVIGTDGVVTHHLTITRTHKGDPEDSLYGVDNTTYVRVYVPNSAEFVEGKGFATLDPRKFLYPKEGSRPDPDLVKLQEGVWIDGKSGTSISTEMGKTVFGNWIETRVGQTSRVELTYRLRPGDRPGARSRKATPYSLYIQKQPGDSRTVFSTRVSDQDHRSVLWKYPQALPNSSDSVWDQTVVLTTDQLFAAVLESD